MRISTSKLALLAVGVCSIVSLSSCKSGESAYKKAYEKAQQQTVTTPPVTTTTPVAMTPVTTTTTTPTKTTTPETSNEPVRTEKVTVISGSGLKAYSVVCGSFGVRTNADRLQKQLKDAGYDAQIVLNNERKLYRVVASTFDDKASAVTSRNKLRGTYADAWLLYNN